MGRYLDLLKGMEENMSTKVSLKEAVRRVILEHPELLLPLAGGDFCKAVSEWTDDDVGEERIFACRADALTEFRQTINPRGNTYHGKVKRHLISYLAQYPAPGEKKVYRVREIRTTLRSLFGSSINDNDLSRMVSELRGGRHASTFVLGKEKEFHVPVKPTKEKKPPAPVKPIMERLLTAIYPNGIPTHDYRKLSIVLSQIGELVKTTEDKT